MLIDQPNRKQRFNGTSGDDEALTELVRSHGRSVRLVLAQYLDRWSAVEQVEAEVWDSLHKEQTISNDLISVLDTTARAAALTYLEAADRQAIQERDVLRRLVVQVALDDLRGQVPAGSPVNQIQERLNQLPGEQRTLLDLYYTRSVALQHLAAQRNLPVADLAHEACAARAACDWRTSAQAPVGDRLLPSLTEDLLSDTLDPDSRALLATSVAQDLGRSVRLERQVRLHLLLRALIGPFTQHETQNIIAAATGQIDHARTQTTSASGSGRTRMRPSEAIRTPISNRRPVSHPTARNHQPVVIAVTVGVGLLVLGALLLSGRGISTDTPSVTMAAAPAAVVPERTTVSSPTTHPATQATATPGASALRPQPLATPSVIPPPPPEPTTSTPTSSAVNTRKIPANSAPPRETVTLINADTDLPIPGYEVLPQDVTIRLSQLPTQHINFDFGAPPEIKSLVFKIPGCSLKSAGTERGRPFSLSNDKMDFKPWTPPPGSYTLTLSVCSDVWGKNVVRTSTWRIRFEK